MSVAYSGLRFGSPVLHANDNVAVYVTFKNTAAAWGLRLCSYMPVIAVRRWIDRWRS